MNQNPTVDNDLQKAIDDITKNTNSDPVFADPVAAPSSIPDGDTGKIAEPIGPFMAPKPASRPAPRPMAPRPVAPRPSAPRAPMPSFAAPKAPMPTPQMPAMPTMPAPVSMPQPSAPVQNVSEVKEAALRDLAPILDKLNIDPTKKFRLYQDMMTELHDNSVIAPAYNSAKEIADDEERGEALLYLLDSINNM